MKLINCPLIIPQEGLPFCGGVGPLTLPKTNISRTWKWMVGRLSRFVLGFGLFSGAMAVRFREGRFPGNLSKSNLPVLRPYLPDLGLPSMEVKRSQFSAVVFNVQIAEFSFERLLHVTLSENYLDVPGRKLGSMVRINGLFHLLILTFDPNFLGHPSTFVGSMYFIFTYMKTIGINQM